MKKDALTYLWLFLAALFLCLTAPPVFAGPHAIASGMTGIFMVLFLFVLFVAVWFFIHSWNIRFSKLVSAVVSLYDFLFIFSIAVVFSSIVLNLRVGGGSYPYGDGLYAPLLSGNDIFHLDRIALLIFCILTVLYKCNRYFSSFQKFDRMLSFAIVGVSTMVVLLTIFEPLVFGSVTRLFINQEKLESTMGHEKHHRERVQGTDERRNVTWLEHFGFQEKYGSNGNSEVKNKLSQLQAAAELIPPEPFNFPSGIFPQEKTFTNSLGMEFVYIPPGEFMMGSPVDEAGRRSDEIQHRVILTKGFYMQATEVTQGQWIEFAGSNPSAFKYSGDHCPVENVSWDDVQEFIKILNRKEVTENYSLPTEAQWEYACRAGTTTPFSTGKCLSTDEANFNASSQILGMSCPIGPYRKLTLPVASFAPNAWGLYDMHGNVREWCQDDKDKYPAGTVTDPGVPSTRASYSSIRGGCWNYGYSSCRSASRGFQKHNYRQENIGFRLTYSPQ